MTQEKLDKIVEQHKHWIEQDCEGWEGMRADLRGANLNGAKLYRADLRGANLRGAKLYRVNLHGANLNGADLNGADLHEADLNEANLNEAKLSEANLRGANLYEANLRWVDLREANLRKANLNGANLYEADLRWADLREANLSVADLNGVDLREANLNKANLNEANLYGTNLSGDNRFRLGQILTDPLTGYKKTKEGVVITAKIPSGAIVFCINGSKCRTNRAKITDMAGHDVLHSQYDNSFEYRFGQKIEIKDFNLTYNVECASGFHFFRTREEAEEYR